VEGWFGDLMVHYIGRDEFIMKYEIVDRFFVSVEMAQGISARAECPEHDFV